ncbi:hypothetical protein NECAME_05146 [Necator americanus]|uniref:Uncharacterized protein n=1 Tax=Necator americanus TaxID=51031 RepID=W2SJ57_NECAM|nr:hypothetical protein NECAME_05146 [Necator americanus]ETN69689.1 hypothetical protein NECAME_05146 [Necator americanus]
MKKYAKTPLLFFYFLTPEGLHLPFSISPQEKCGNYLGRVLNGVCHILPDSSNRDFAGAY